MDLKAMAKSKRSHTKHHHPKKPHHSSISTPTSSSSSTTTPNKQVGDKKKGPPPPPSLPSNWDRYYDVEDEDEYIPINSGSDDPNPSVVKPKSKGANYTTLIAHAKESRSYYSPSFDDNFPDSYQGVAPMLSLRGEKIILEHRDDDFLMEDKGRDNQEAHFLTLDLKDLAERLSKVDIAKRLFIEPDLFPPELLDQDENNAYNPVQSPEKRKIERIDSFGELLVLYLEEEQMAEKLDVLEKDSALSSNPTSYQVAEQDSKGDLTETKFKELGKSTLPKCDSEDLEFLDKDSTHHVSPVPEQEARPPSRFEAASAGAELDMLLGSFNETQIFDNPPNKPGSSYNFEHVATYGASIKPPVGQSRPGFPVTSSLDDELDDLLAETSNLDNEIHDKHTVFQPITQLPASSLPQPNAKTKDLEDFDSWMDTISQ